MDNEWQNNVSTIAVIVYGVLAPYIAQYLSQEQFSALCIAVVGIIVIVWSATHPNTMDVFGNKPNDCVCNEEIILNEEYTVNPTDDGDDQ